jgi:hypothetical protein
MPRLSRWAIRAALIDLGIGFTLGALILINKGLGVWPAAWRWLPTHIEFLMMGWTLQLVMGMGFWILPRFGQGRSRGNEPMAWTALVLLNAGLLAVALGPLIGNPGWLPVVGRMMEAAAGVTFTGHAWSRVKPPGM